MIDAPSSRKMFVVAAARQLARVAKEQTTRKQAIASLRKLYDKMLKAYLRTEGTTYSDWCDRGPKAVLDELLAAYEDGAIWDQLVDRYDVEAREVAS